MAITEPLLSLILHSVNLRTRADLRLLLQSLLSNSRSEIFSQASLEKERDIKLQWYSSPAIGLKRFTTTVCY